LKNNYAYVSPGIEPLREQEFLQSNARWIYQMILITKRNFLVYLRVPDTSWLKISVAVAVALLIAAMFSNLDSSQAGVRNRNGVLFFIAEASSFISLQYVVLVFPHERPVFLREYASNMYSIGPYFFGRLLAELPAGLIVPSLFGSIIYFIVKLNTDFWYKFPLHSK
jgi:ABC-type multidrug transport system permease subunit